MPSGCERTAAAWLCLLVSIRAFAGEPAEAAFARALSLYEEGHPAEASILLAEVAREDPGRAGVWFWLARAARKAGDAVTAESAIARSLELDPDSPDALYLGGLVAAEAGDRPKARARLARVAELDPSGELGLAAARHQEELAWLDDRDRAVQLAHSGGDPREALAKLDLVLERHPGDGWTRLWRARALATLGRGDEARAEFQALAENADLALADAARAELIPRSPRVRWRMSAGAAVDTNPRLVSEAVRALEPQTGAGWAAGASADIGLARWGASRLLARPAAAVRDYAQGEADFAQASAGVELRGHGEAARWWVGGEASGAWLGWAPYLDLEELGGGLAWPRGSLEPHVGLTLFRRGSRLDAYANLDSYGAQVLPELRIGTDGPSRLSAGWILQAERGQAYSLRWSGSTADDLLYDAVLDAEATWVGHGPRAEAHAELGAGPVELGVALEYVWRRYGPAERVLYDVGGETISGSTDRRDRRLGASAMASARLRGPAWAFARYAGVVNASTAEPDAWPVDRSYSRHLALAGLEVRR